MLLEFLEPPLAGPVGKSGILELTLTAFVADRTIQRMIGQDELQHRLAGLRDLRSVSPDYHALGNRQRARGHQLRGLLDLDQTKAAGTLKSKSFVVAE